MNGPEWREAFEAALRTLPAPVAVHDGVAALHEQQNPTIRGMVAVPAALDPVLAARSAWKIAHLNAIADGQAVGLGIIEAVCMLYGYDPAAWLDATHVLGPDPIPGDDEAYDDDEWYDLDESLETFETQWREATRHRQEPDPDLPA